MSIIDRYSSAVRSSNLRGRSETDFGAAKPADAIDIIGAAGLAAKKRPLALALMRLFVGDNKAARELVRLLAEMARNRATTYNIALKRTQADDIARAVLAWHRDGVCKACGGHGFLKLEFSPGLSDSPCRECVGVGKVLFESNFTVERRVIARWLLAEVEREQARAGPAAMAKLAPRLDL